MVTQGIREVELVALSLAEGACLLVSKSQAAPTSEQFH